METNREYMDKSSQTVKKQTKKLTWHNLSIQELKIYVGIIIMLGIDKKPEIQMHWQIHGSNLIRQSMSVCHFIMINKFLNVGDKNSTDKLSRIRKLSDYIKECSLNYYKSSSKNLN